MYWQKLQSQIIELKREFRCLQQRRESFYKKAVQKLSAGQVGGSVGPNETKINETNLARFREEIEEIEKINSLANRNLCPNRFTSIHIKKISEGKEITTSFLEKEAQELAE